MSTTAARSDLDSRGQREVIVAKVSSEFEPVAVEADDSEVGGVAPLEVTEVCWADCGGVASEDGVAVAGVIGTCLITYCPC